MMGEPLAEVEKTAPGAWRWKPVRLGAVAEIAAAIVGAALLFVTLGEAATRLLNRDGRIYDLEMFKYSRSLKRDAPPEASEMHHWHVPSAAARLQGVEIRINSQGLRDREHAYATPPGVTRIAVLGDSVTLGWGVGMEESYPRVLERLLNDDARARRYEVINGGVGNYTTSRIIALYRYELQKYSPRVVVFSFFLNDANETSDSKLRFVFDTPLQFPVLLWSRLQRAQARYGLGRDFDRYYFDLYADGSPSYREFRARLSAFLAELHHQGKTAVVACVPDVLHLQEPVDRYRPITDKVLAIAAEQGAFAVDLFPALQGLAPGDIMNTPEDRHPNAEGHRRLGTALFRYLKSLGI
jgi:lysophospholipase L1-like esterase